MRLSHLHNALSTTPTPSQYVTGTGITTFALKVGKLRPREIKHHPDSKDGSNKTVVFQGLGLYACFSSSEHWLVPSWYLVSSILQIKTLRARVIRQLAQCHMAESNWLQSPDLFLIVPMATKLRGNLSSGSLPRMWLSGSCPCRLFLHTSWWGLAVNSVSDIHFVETHGWPWSQPQRIQLFDESVGESLGVFLLFGLVHPRLALGLLHSSTGLELDPKGLGLQVYAPCPVYASLGIEPRASCMWSWPAVNWATSLALPPCFSFPAFSHLSNCSLIKCTQCKIPRLSPIVGVQSVALECVHIDA